MLNALLLILISRVVSLHIPGLVSSCYVTELNMRPLPASPATLRVPHPRSLELAPCRGDSSALWSSPLVLRKGVGADGKRMDPGRVGKGKLERHAHPAELLSWRQTHPANGGPGAHPLLLTPSQALAEAWSSRMCCGDSVRHRSCRDTSVLVLGHRACEVRAWEEASLPMAAQAQAPHGNNRCP